jgi:hypothetical protein
LAVALNRKKNTPVGKISELMRSSKPALYGYAKENQQGVRSF